MVFTLKQYQQRCLDVLRSFFRLARMEGAASAFYRSTQRPYVPVQQFPGMPYICVRVPTGGGKTVIASHAVGITAQEWLLIERGVVLWLAPTNVIVQQTLSALRDRHHPYRQALDGAFDGRVSVLSLAEALYLQRGMLESDTVIIVSTLAALRVEDTEGRKVYETSGYLQHHFTGLEDEQRPLLETDAEGNFPKSLANVLRLRAPIVIVDEAHNARTHLSFETLARFRPACIVEFTATPDQETNPSNIVYHVSAAELKAEAMIKLPIRLLTLKDWKEAMAAAIARQGQLEQIAIKEATGTGEYIRPIVLFQAQSRSATEQRVTADILKQVLLSDFDIREQEIAVATGEVRDLDNVDISSRDCPIKFIITVQALREGWDCPFAYILCSVANLTHNAAVEQLLGRVLRLPRAQFKTHEELNQAYAFATSQGFADAAEALTDALIESGFQAFEARQFITPAEPGTFDFTLDLPPEPIAEGLREAPKLEQLPEQLKSAIKFDTTTKQLVYSGPAMTGEDVLALLRCVSGTEDETAVRKIGMRSRGEQPFPAALQERFDVPWLAVRENGQLEIFQDQFLDSNWKLSSLNATLSEVEFPRTLPTSEAVLDVNDQGQIGYRFVQELHHQLELLHVRGPQTPSELAAWLDRGIPHPDVTHSDAGLFLLNMVNDLTGPRGIPLEELVESRYRLREAAAAKIASHRRSENDRRFQEFLFSTSSSLEVDPGLCFEFPPEQYAANSLYEGPVRFNKHYYKTPGHMNPEEAKCALLIDSLEQVKFWVRNLERSPYSFWLPTSTDSFYPDFVAKLNDGRVFVVEYKGEMLATTEDTKEKTDVGTVWESLSKGRCLFRLVRKHDMEGTLRDAVAAKAAR